MAGGALVLRENDTRRQSIPLAMIDRLVIQGARTVLDTSVLTQLAEAGASTLLLSPRASRRVAMVLGPAHNDAAIRLAQTSRVMDEAYCSTWAREQILAKLRRQHRLLSDAEQNRADKRKPLFDARASINKAIETLQGELMPALERIRGLEGSAARAYFQGYTSLFAPDLHFTGRNKRPPRDPVNACLSLAYTMAHFDAVRAAHSAGLDPLLGFFHRPAYGRESLASDLIEPLRPAVDAWVWSEFRNGQLRGDHFRFDKGACLLGKAGRAHFHAAWDRFAVLPRRWLRRRCALLARQLRTEGSSWLEQAEADPEF